MPTTSTEMLCQLYNTEKKTEKVFVVDVIITRNEALTWTDEVSLKDIYLSYANCQILLKATTMEAFKHVVSHVSEQLVKTFCHY